MITNLQEFITELNKAWLSMPLNSRADTKIKAYLNGRYIIDAIEMSKDDGAIILWLDERGDPEER